MKIAEILKHYEKKHKAFIKTKKDKFRNKIKKLKLYK